MSKSQRLPIVTLILILANILVAFAQFMSPEIAFSFGFVNADPKLQNAFTSLFIHENLIHLFGNMLFLAAVGPAVEFAAKTWRFGLIYLVGGLVGVLAHYLISPASQAETPLIGASGSVAACVAYVAIRFGRVKVPLAPKVSIPVYGVVFLWVSLQILGGFVSIGAQHQGGAAWWSHLGGIAAGLLFTVVFRASTADSVQFGHEILDRMNDRGPAASQLAAEQHLSKYPKDIVALKHLFESSKDLVDQSKAVRAAFELLELLPEAEQLEYAEYLVTHGGLSSLPPLRRMLLADRFKSIDTSLSLKIYSDIQSDPDAETYHPDVMLAMIELQKESTPSVCEALAEQLVRDYPLHPATELARARGLLP